MNLSASVSTTSLTTFLQNKLRMNYAITPPNAADKSYFGKPRGTGLRLARLRSSKAKNPHVCQDHANQHRERNSDGHRPLECLSLILVLSSSNNDMLLT